MTVTGTTYKFSSDDLSIPQIEHNPVRRFIDHHKMTQKEFARKLGVSDGAVSQWLSWKRKIPGPVLAYMDLYRHHKFLETMYEVMRK